MDETLFIGCAFGLFVFVVGGSALAVFNFFQLRSLDRRLRRLEAGATPIEAPARPTSARSAVASPPPESKRRAFDLEALVAGQWLHRIGILAVLLGTAFFLKYAFDNDWIGPAGRVAIGLVSGIGLIAASQWFHRRDYRAYSDGIAALGGGIVFLSLYAAWDFYELIPPSAAFVGMLVITGALAVLASVRNSQRLAVLALLGGLLTPGLISVSLESQTTLFAYLLALGAGFLAIGWTKSWRWLGPIALAGVILYFTSWSASFYQPDRLLPTLGFATLLFVLFGCYCALIAGRRSKPHWEEVYLIVVNALWFGIALHVMLYEDHRWWLTIAVLAAAALHLALARHSGSLLARFVFAGLALALATAAIAIRLEGLWMTLAITVEGATLVWAGFKTNLRSLRLTGLALLAIAVALLFDGSDRDRPFVLNRRFIAFTGATLALYWSNFLASRHGALVSLGERRIFEVAGLVANAVAVWAVSEEVWRLLGTSSGGFEPRLARQLGLSLLWTASGGLLIAAGARRDSKPVRWQGLLLIGLTVAKVFLFDLSFLERGYRIISIVALGLVLLLVSFFYQRRLAPPD